MRVEALTKAKARLARAKQALAGLEDREALDEFETNWSDLLIALGAIYTVLEQGAKSSPQSRQWFGGKKRERRNDPLLQYLHQARNAEEHGVEPVTQGSSSQIKLYGQPEYFYGIGMPDGHTIHLGKLPPGATGFAVTFTEYRLIPVRNDRYKDVFNPPQEHLGTPLTDNSPLTVARLAVAHIEAIVAEAENLS